MTIFYFLNKLVWKKSGTSTTGVKLSLLFATNVLDIGCKFQVAFVPRF